MFVPLTQNASKTNTFKNNAIYSLNLVNIEREENKAVSLHQKFQECLGVSYLSSLESHLS